MAKYYTSIVSRNVATALREAGYTQNVGHHWYDSTTLHLIGYLPDETCINAPFYAEVFDWLLDKGLSVETSSERPKEWYALIWHIGTNKPYGETPTFNTWHSAADAAILKAIETLKER